MKKFLNKAMGGFVYVGIIGAVFLGFLFFLSMIFGADSSLTARIIFGVLALLSFISGYISSKESEVNA
ncbi:hypothetical protein J2T13_000190 [Paenibacillus sp. DS2015]|uniref:hypothetical protein n=1 Tax=Paenibacillus sp. DS2015 TaxID=3373917 RepID=UPI003D2505A2